jgi:hypothetical protein
MRKSSAKTQWEDTYGKIHTWTIGFHVDLRMGGGGGTFGKSVGCSMSVVTWVGLAVIFDYSR